MMDLAQLRGQKRLVSEIDWEMTPERAGSMRRAGRTGKDSVERFILPTEF